MARTVKKILTGWNTEEYTTRAFFEPFSRGLGFTAVAAKTHLFFFGLGSFFSHVKDELQLICLSYNFVGFLNLKFDL